MSFALSSAREEVRQGAAGHRGGLRRRADAARHAGILVGNRGRPPHRRGRHLSVRRERLHSERRKVPRVSAYARHGALSKDALKAVRDGLRRHIGDGGREWYVRGAAEGAQRKRRLERLRAQERRWHGRLGHAEGARRGRLPQHRHISDLEDGAAAQGVRHARTGRRTRRAACRIFARCVCAVSAARVFKASRQGCVRCTPPRSLAILRHRCQDLRCSLDHRSTSVRCRKRRTDRCASLTCASSEIS